MERVLTLVLLCSLFAMGQMMPEDVREVSVTYRTETELTLQWETVNSSYSYKLERDGVENEPINGTEPGLVTHKVSNLSSGTLYSFTLYTVFEEKQSTGFPFSNVTAPSNAANVSVTNRNETETTLQFEKAGHSSNYAYELEHKVKQTLKCTTRDSFVVCEVKALSPGTEYSFTLYTVFEGVRSSGYNFTSVTVPSDVANVSVTDRKETEMTLKWDKVNNNDIYTYELEYNGERHQTDLVEYTVKDLSSGTQYFFTLYTVFENVTSNGYNFTNVTVPSDVASVSVTDRKETEMTLKWDKVNNNDSYTYELEYNGERHQTGIKVEYTVKDLSSGTQYFFTLYTVFENVTSNGYNFTNVTVPSKVENLGLAKGNDTDVILQWDKTKEQKDKTYEYTLEFSNNSYENITVTAVENKIMCHISGLIPATNYTFTVYTNFFDVRSTGANYSHTTTLSRVTNIRVTRSLTELNITWNKLNNNSIYNYTLYESDILQENFIGSHMNVEKTYRYQKLTPGKVYSFKLDTVVHDARNSSSFKNITTLDCESFKWNVTNSSISAQVNGSTEVKAVNSSSNTNIAPVTNNKVDLQGLYPGATYNVSLLYVLDTQTLEQCSHSLTLDPNSVPNLRCEYFSGGYGLAVSWDQPHGVVDVVQVDIGKRSFNRTSNDPRLEVKDLQAAQWYKVTATSFSKAKKSQTESLNCQTNPAGVIAGVLVFFLLIILICAAVYFWRRYRSAKHNKSSSRLVEPKVTNKSYKLIPVDKFPEYFQNMSCDENRGFSEEYEDLSSVGIEQSSAAALLPKNKDKNRFTNVLPYDSTRVQLTVNDEDDSDYINANYMPGYGNSRKEYIAAQGPLPYTVNDFWRMIWDKRSQVIVMVTNCTESGRVKCEQYWPLDFMPCLYGNLVVTVKSENKAPSWTLREFDVKNKSTSETRTVKHFHFTAWPDHGVPSGTEELIKFRGLVRQHIESSSSEGPTVVHCSAGVGRTGTLIALDVLLQQLDREKAVGIAAFVQQMRFCRPLMVQTESQYVFLHQCIMDSLQTKVMAASEPLYENSDMIYVNAIALRQYENGSQI